MYRLAFRKNGTVSAKKDSDGTWFDLHTPEETADLLEDLREMEGWPRNHALESIP